MEPRYSGSLGKVNIRTSWDEGGSIKTRRYWERKESIWEHNGGGVSGKNDCMEAESTDTVPGYSDLLLLLGQKSFRS